MYLHIEKSQKLFLLQQDARRRHSSSPLGSTGSSNESLRTPEDLINRSEEEDVHDTAAAFENGEFSISYGTYKKMHFCWSFLPIAALCIRN